ncbi:hypothetical protein MPSEU_000471700 [Mayamaea pseudoterrestris]|nr:hypothetical protein MPSEU_000471700 [Mayamaea pseudoterrestris]
MMDATPKPLRSLVQEARRAFALGLKPEFVLDGSGGTYFLHDAHKNKIAVFKPSDEEPYAPANPRGYLPIGGSGSGEVQSLRKGVAPGEACIREVAAFLLDHDGVCTVPMTTLVEARHSAFNNYGSRMTVANGGASIGSHSISPALPGIMANSDTKKVGSLQEFVRCDGTTMDDISPSLLSVEEVQKIALLDIRILNADRNAANLLVRRRTDDSLELIPIDHGFCLRTVSDVSWMDWCWLDWPQLKQPVCDHLKNYIAGLDIEADALLLSERLNICREAIDFFRASSSLLKAGVNAGLTLYDIAILCCRNDNLGEVPSMLEKLLDMASELAYVAIKNDRWHHSAASRAIVEQLNPVFQRRSSVAAGLSSKNWISKAASSSNFLSLHKGSHGQKVIADASLFAAEFAPPGMAQSSASSESSVEPVDAIDEAEENEDCEEWAASVILNVSVEQFGTTGRVNRSDSVSSDGSTDSGHRGFWHVRPSFSPEASDDGSESWDTYDHEELSFEPDFTSQIEISKPKDTKFATVTFAPDVPLVDGSRSSLVSNRLTTLNARRPSMINSSEGDFLLQSKRPSTMSFTESWTTDDTTPALPPPLPRSESNISRSKSYSALSAVSGSGDTKKNAAVQQERLSEDDNLFRNYFHSFIDLVITRETTVALHNSKRHA